MKPFRENFVDSSAAEIYDDGRWDLTLPSGKHVRGQETNVDEATVAVHKVHDQFILDCWKQGTLYPHNSYLCPLNS